MATFQISPPVKFTFSQPENWTKWIQRFIRFRSASGLTEKEEEAQVNCLIYSMGPEADDIFNSFNLSAENKKKFKPVKERFDKYFIVRRNVIYERAKFNLRVQQDGEPVDSYITSLHSLSEHCEYGDLHEEMIRDRIVVGIRDSRLSEKLQLDAELTLKKATDTVRQSEAVKKQQAELMKSEVSRDSQEIDAVKKRGGKYKPAPNKFQNQKRGSFVQKSSNNRCGRCGKSPDHSREKCPARDAVCRKCDKKGHYAVVCKSKPVNEISGAEVDFLGAIQTSENSQPWMVKLRVNGTQMTFKLDTGADVTVIPESLFNKMKSPKLSKAKRKLYGPNKSQLNVRGVFTAEFETDKKISEQTVYVVRGLSQPLLGRPAIERLELIAKVDGVEIQGKSYKEKYPKLFSGLGKTDWEYKITLKDDAKPFALSTHRRIALSLMDKVKAELSRMENLGVISKVEQPTDWCAGMVVVPKVNNDVRICVDLTKLNESVCRENYPLPDINQTLGRLSGAKKFTKLDANSGFYQITLAEQSRLLTTFITPFGRYCYNRLPFGISAAPEFFQKRMSQLLAGGNGRIIMSHGRYFSVWNY